MSNDHIQSPVAAAIVARAEGSRFVPGAASNAAQIDRNSARKQNLHAPTAFAKI